MIAVGDRIRWPSRTVCTVPVVNRHDRILPGPGSAAAPYMRQLIILAVHTFQHAAGEKYSTGTAVCSVLRRTRDARFFPVMQHGATRIDIRRHTADTGLPVQPVSATASGAKPACRHDYFCLRQSLIFPPDHTVRLWHATDLYTQFFRQLFHHILQAAVLERIDQAHAVAETEEEIRRGQPAESLSMRILY